MKARWQAALSRADCPRAFCRESRPLAHLSGAALDAASVSASPAPRLDLEPTRDAPHGRRLGRTANRSPYQPRGGLVDQVDRLVGQETAAM